MFRRSFVEAKKKAKIGSLRIHDLRHSCASRMIREGVNIVVGKILGHKDIKTTMIYCHSEEKDEALAIEKMSAIYSDERRSNDRKEISELVSPSELVH